MFEILSMSPDSYGRSLRSYHIDGSDTIGVFGDEPYAIRLRASDQPVSVQILIDGTDITTGNPAKVYDTDTGGERFMVKMGPGCTIQTWFESFNGGSQLVFRHRENTVAEHTHGDSLGQMGTIQVVYYVEGDPAPSYNAPYREFGGHTRGGLEGMLGGAAMRGAAMRGGSESGQPMSYGGDSASKGYATRGAAGTGAGAHVEQRFTEVPGFRMPILSHVETVSYMWWDDLTATLERLGIKHDEYVGAAGRKFADLGSTPRPQENPSGYQRFKPARR